MSSKMDYFANARNDVTKRRGTIPLSVVRCFLRDTRGTTIIEFAVVALIFFLLLCGALEFGLITYTQVALENAVDQAGRNVMVSANTAGCDRICQFENDVRTKTSALIGHDSITFQENVINAAGADVAPDVCNTTPPSSPAVCPAGTTYQDNNGDGVYTPPIGNSGDQVHLQVHMAYPIQFPIFKTMFTGTDASGATVSGVFNITASTIIKNE